MADEKVELRELNFRQLLPWTELFRGFQVALDPKKLLLAAAGILAMAVGWYVIALAAFAWHAKPQPTDAAYAGITGETDKETRDRAWQKFREDRARWNVHVERLALQLLVRDVELVAVRTNPRERDLRRLLHHVAELAGEDEPALAVHVRRLDEEHVAAGAGHGKAGRDTGHGGPLGGLLPEALAAEGLAHQRLVDRDRRISFAGGDPGRGLA